MSSGLDAMFSGLPYHDAFYLSDITGLLRKDFRPPASHSKPKRPHDQRHQA